MTNNKSRFFDKKLNAALFSLILAVLLWFYVTGTDGAETTRQFKSVKVVFDGQEELQESSGLIVTSQDTRSVDLVLSGPRRAMGKLSDKALTVTVDLHSFANPGNYTMLYTVNYPDGITPEDITVVESSPNTVYVSLERLTGKKVEVKGSFTGTAAEGYLVDDALIFEPLTVKVSGPQSQVDAVDCAWVSITRENVDSTLSYMTTYTLLDADKNKIDTSDLTVDVDEVSVTLNVLMTKTVALKASLIPGGGAGEENTLVEVEPRSIILAGAPETLDAVNQIVVDTVKLAGVNRVYEADGLIIPIPNDTMNLSGISTASVHLEIQNLETASFGVAGKDVVFTNLPAGMSVECITETLPVLVRSTAEDIETVTDQNIRVVCDLSEVTGTGILNLPVKVNVDGHTLAGAVGEYKIYVRLGEEE